MAKNVLRAQPRNEKGKNAMHRIRKSGFIPAILYGTNLEPQPLSINEKELEHSLLHRSRIVKLKVENGGEFDVLYREVQRDPITEKLQHVDLMGITTGKKIKAKVPILTMGIPVGVKTSGGILEIICRQLDVECLPKDLPEEITVDVSNINIGASLHVADLKLENILILNDPKTTIATVVAPTVVKAAVEVAEAAPAEGEEAEVETEEKKTEQKE
jgi:large subunit ribosomal protein L25